MNTKSVKVGLIALLMVMISAFALVFITGAKVAKAETVFGFESGAYVKLADDGGLRFRLQMDEETATGIKTDDNKTLYFYVASAARMASVTTGAGAKALNTSGNAWEVSVDKTKIYAGKKTNGNLDGYYYANILLDINALGNDEAAKLAYRTTDFVAMATVYDQEANDGEGGYTNTAKSPSRSLQYTASAGALRGGYYNDIKTTYNWLGTENYPIIVKNDADYTALKNVALADNRNLYFGFDGVDDYDGLVDKYAENYAFETMVSGGNSGGLYQTYTGLKTDLPVGTVVTVEMDVKVTGDLSAETGAAYWVDAVWSTSGGESDKTRTSIKSLIDTDNTTTWQHITFTATVRNFPNLRYNSSYTTQDTSAYGNAVYLITQTPSAANSFNYRNVEITEQYTTMISGGKNAANYYQSITGLTTDLPVGTAVTVDMDIFVTGTFEDTACNIYWLNTVYSNNLWNNSPKIVDNTTAAGYKTAGTWQHITFDATVRNFTSAGIHTAMDTSAYGNAVYLISRQKSADAFNYKNVEITELYKPMVSGGANTTNNGFYQSMTGLTTDFAVGTGVIVTMDVKLNTAGSNFNNLHWVNSIYGSYGGAVNNKTSIKTAFTDLNDTTNWQTITFTATVRNFEQLRVNTSQYDPVDTSSFGNAVYIIAEANGTADPLYYKNVVISTSAMAPNGNNGNSNDMYYQSITGLSTDFAAGTSVTVSMDVLVTGTFNSYSHIYWADTVYTEGGGELNGKTDIKSLIDTDDTITWQHITFTATVRNFSVLRIGTAYPTPDTSAYKNAVYLISQNKSADSFNYKNVVIEIPESMTSGGKNAANYYQSITGLTTDLPVGTAVTVDMDIFVTGTFEDTACNIYWLDTVYSNNLWNNSPKIVDNTTAAGYKTAGTWQHITFDATVRNFTSAGIHAAMENLTYGNAVYLISRQKTADAFNYANVQIAAHMKSGGKNAQNYYQSITGLSTDLPVGTAVTVDMDIFVTGTFEDSYSACNIYWLDTVYSNNLWHDSPKIVDTTTAAGYKTAGTWQHITFTATVRNFEIAGIFAEIDTSAYGNAVYLVSRQKTADAFNYKNVVISTAMPESGNNGNESNKFYQGVAGLCTDLDAGTPVLVEMEVYITGTFDSKSGIYFVDSVYSNNLWNDATKILSGSDAAAAKGTWTTVSFYATVRNFESLGIYSAANTAAYGNAVYIVSRQRTANSFDYRNVKITAIGNVEINNYNIVVADSEYEDSDSPVYKAATILKGNIEAAGGSIDIVSDSTTKSVYEIVLGSTNRKTIKNYDQESYRIKNDILTLYIEAADSRGAIYGVYAWLESVGFRFEYINEGATATTIPSFDDIKVSDIDISYSPAFEYREVVDKSALDVDWAVSVGINGDIGKTDIRNAEYGGYIEYINGASNTHTSIGSPYIVNKVHIDGFAGTAGVYNDEIKHTDWFAVDENGDPYVTSYEAYTDTQICLSSEGALDKAKTYLIYWIANYNPQTTCRVMVSIMDNDNYCKCSSCTAKYETYGTTGAWLMWVNELADHVKTSGYTNVYIETLAYGWVKGLPTGGVKPRDNVIVRFCTDFGGCINDRENSANLASEKELLEGWLAICDNVYVWYYSIDYGNYMEIYPNFDDIYYNLNYIYRVGVKGVYSEQFLKNNGEFGELRSYLVAKMLQKPWMTKEEFDELKVAFCNNYYGAAGTYVLSYIDAVKDAMTGDIGKLAKATENNIDFTSDLKNACEDYWDAAESAVSDDATLLTRVKKSRLHWTFAMLSNCQSSFTPADYANATQKLAEDMYDLNVRSVKFTASISDDRSDFSRTELYKGKNPANEWKYNKLWHNEAAD